MKLTVLLDNNTFTDRYFQAEPGLSFFIEAAGGTRVLFDCGYSQVFLQNAAKLKIDLAHLDALVLSHSHLDHTWGLQHLIQHYMERSLEDDLFGSSRNQLKTCSGEKPWLVTHPETFVRTLLEPVGDIGTLLSSDRPAYWFDPVFTETPFELSEHLVFLGAIPRLNDFEAQTGIGRKSGAVSPDLIPEDSAMVYKSPKGLVIITGCSHAGICNIISYAREVCQEERIHGVVGGLHLLNPSRSQLEGTLEFFKTITPSFLYAGHCTDLASKIALASVAPVREVGVGLVVEC